MNTIIWYTLSIIPNFLSRHTSDEKESGEGVVSSAIAVVIFSALGVAMWLAFRATMNTATSMVTSQVAQLGN